VLRLPDVIVVGDVMLDVVVASPALRRGGDVHGDVRVRPGGGGANAAVWAASAGARVRLHGRVGADLAGRLLRDALAERGVDARLAEDAASRTGTMLVVTEAGDRSMVADRGANARWAREEVPARLQAGAVLVSGYLLFHPGSEAAAVAALERAEAGHLAVDGASWPLIREYGPARFLSATQNATLFLGNRRESAAVTGQDPEDDGVDPEAVATRLARHYETVVVKLGPDGALMVNADGLVSAPAPETVESDPTGAGDAFDGALLAVLAAGGSPTDALHAACRAGAQAAASNTNWPEP
jgi:sugar/nucleoside kinase (ribokinase family)